MAPESVEVNSQDNSKYKDGVNRNARLIVRNISFKATEESLKKHFAPYGTIEEVKLLRKPDGKLVGCGFIHYTHVPMANKAIAATNKKPFMDRPINVSWAVPKNKYVEEAGKNATEKVQRKFNTASDDSKDEIKEEENHDSKPAKEDKNKTRVNRNARLIIRNVSFKATEESLREHFEPYGNILEVKLLKKPDGKLVGCAFVHFKNVPMAKKALLSTNMKPYLGRPISVDWAVAKDKYMQHIVNSQVEMQDAVKKEESDSDDDDDSKPINLSGEDLKQEVKSESDDSDKEGSGSESDGSDEESDDDDDDEDDDDDDEKDIDDDDQDDKQSVISEQPGRQRIKLNDAEDGCTVFITNIPFSVDNDQLRQLAETVAPVKYALVCVDKMTEHSKGSGFIKFTTKEDADKFLSLPSDQLRLEGQVLLVKPALKRENLTKDKKQPKDNRNLYLVKEGVVVAGTKAAVGVSASDMAKRLALERSKTQMLKNLNRFVSRYRLVVSNLPSNYEDSSLRQVCVGAAGRGGTVTEARVMRDLRAAPDRNGKHPSKGYGFVMFTRHEDALTCLRKLNNNPDVFDKNNRPIVSFSIEDRTALNARKKRLEKSIANNPLANKEGTEKLDHQAEGNKRIRNRKRKQQNAPDESYVKKGRFDRNNDSEQSNRFQNNAAKNWKFDRNNDSDQKNRFQNNAAKRGKFDRNNDLDQRNKFQNNAAKRGKFDWNNDSEQSNKFQNNATRKGKFDRNNDSHNRNRFQNNKQNSVGRFVRRPTEDEYTGLTAKEGAQHKMRSNFKLRTQADVHRQNVKLEKKKSWRAQKMKRAMKERVKQPKQRVNKDGGKKKRKKAPHHKTGSMSNIH